MGRNIPEVRRTPCLEDRLDDRLSVRAVQALARDDHHAAVSALHGCRLLQKFLLDKRVLRRIQKVRRVLILLPRKCGRRRRPARVASQSFHHHDVDRQTPHVHAQLPDGSGHIPRNASEARTVIRHRDIVIHRFRDPHHADPRPTARRFQPAARVHGAVSAVHQNKTDIVRL